MTRPRWHDFLIQRYPFFGYIWEFRKQRGRVALAALLAAIKHSPVVCLPLYIGFIIDTIIPRRDLEGLAWCVLGMSSLIMMNVAMHPLFMRLYSAMRRDVSLDLRARLCRRIQRLVFAYHDSHQSGRLHSKVMNDVEKLDRVGAILIDPLMITVLTVIFATIYVVVKEPLFAILLVLFVPTVLAQQRIFRRRLEEKNHSLRIELERLNSDVTEMLTMLPVSRAHATETEDLSRIRLRLDSLRDMGVGTDWITHLLQSQMWGATQLVTIAVVGFGAFMAINGRMTAGEVVMFLSFTGMTIGGLSGILSQIVMFFEGAEAMKSINEVLHYPMVENNEGKPELGPLKGHIEFRDVWFAYPGNDRPVFKSLNLDVTPQQTIALVGASGAGKTSFVKLLLGFYRPIEGSILLDGKAMTEIDLRSFRRQVGIVTQETFLFNGTIFQNLAHGLGNVARADVEEAARQANAYDFIMQQERGFDAEIGDRGVRLSGGQKQRLAIARALLRKPRLLILDEATSALDSESELLVQQALERLRAGRTAFVIAHRLSTIRNADRILVFDNGRIAEDGRHDVLLAQGGIYARLVELQQIA